MKATRTTPDGLIVVTEAASASTHKLTKAERKARRVKNKSREISNKNKKRRKHGQPR